MNKYVKAKQFVENSNVIIMSNEFKKNNIDKYFINKLIKENIFERYEKGI